MKKNYFMAIAVAALMLATTVAQAADVTFSGQFRPRAQINDDANDLTTQRGNFDTRVRLNAKANVNANTEVFLQMQSVGTWGRDLATAATETSDTSDRDSSAGSDILADVGFHQAYLTLKNFMGQAVDMKIGRQEVVLDGHRLFGHTGWTQGAQTNDAIRFNHSAGNHTINYIYIASDEAGSASASNNQNQDIHILRAATQGIMGGDLQGYFVMNDDQSSAAVSDDGNKWFTVGARQKGKIGGLDYRVEYYHQFGDGGVPATASDQAEAYTVAPNNSADIDREASMFGIRVGKTFKNAKFSPSITLWYDVLSGQDDDDVTGTSYGAFDTLQDTGHKFYGLIDNFGGTGAGTGTGWYGLQDFAVKTKWQVAAGNTLKIDFHHFETQTSLDDNDSDTIRGNANTSGAFTAALAGAGTTSSLDSSLGQEIDVTFVHKYDSNTKIVAGYSHYFTTNTMGMLNSSGGTIGRTAMNDQDWMYVMIDTKF
jgi:hypothetical protein